MSHTVTIARAARGSILVPAGEIEIYLLNGWRLTDEPGCDGARMLPPSCIHRVPDNEKAGRGGTREPAKNIRANDARRTQRVTELQAQR